MLAAGLLMASHMVAADDTDILAIEVPPATPNVLFVFDTSGSMNWELDSDTKPSDPADSRLSVLRDAFTALLTNPDLPEVNMGLMNFSGHDGSWLAHGPAYPVSAADAQAQTVLNSNPLFTHPGISYLPAPASGDTSKDFLQTVASTWNAKGKTPLVDALYEATLYLKGAPLKWGLKPPNDLRAAHPSSYHGLIEKTTISSTNYVCNDEPCGGTTGVACNSTMSCTTQTKQYHNCWLSSEAACLAANPDWNSCDERTGNSCNKTCPDGIYDEAGKCVNPVTNCSPYTYYRCEEDVNITRCEHEVCGDKVVTSTDITGEATYKSPITEACQSSHIILLSDGEPTVNNSSTLVSDFMGSGFANGCDSGSDDGRCGPELAKYLAETDHLPDLEGDHAINVHTIGLALSDNNVSATDYLKKLAENGQGGYASADTPEQLVSAFLSTLGNLTSKAVSFSAPSYSLDKNSILAHGDEVFVPLFKSSRSSVWSGNLKKFRLKDGKLVDKNDVPVADANGVLRKDAPDEWSKPGDTLDDAVTDGGAAARLNPATRRLFSSHGASLLPLGPAFPGIKSKLGDAGMTNAYRDQLLAFIRGYAADGNVRRHIGDIIHGKPVHLSYDASYGSRGVVFVGTNEGLLHAFNDDDGSEASAFMPDLLLGQIAPQFEALTNGAKSVHLYGVDGELTLWHDDKNNNNIKESGENAILYLSLRRGGRAYYAIDVNDPANPSLLWKLDHTATGFSSLAHSWSKPVLAKIQYKPNTSTRPVLVFGGGYSDDASGNEISGQGNAVFIVDAMSGALVWSTKVAETLSSTKDTVDHAVAGKVRVLDVDRNGSADRLYFADTGGNVWRADLNASDLDGSGDSGNISKATLMKFAELGKVLAPAKSPRKFFIEPDVSIFNVKGQPVLSVAIGSGDRPNPLDKEGDDRFFVLFDEFVFNTPKTGTKPIKTGDLAASPVATGTDLISHKRTKKGWYLDLATPGLVGEKVLTSALTYQGMVLFTSFGNDPSAATVQECGVSQVNVSRLYALDLLQGTAALDLDKDGTVTEPADSSIVVAYGEIADTPQVIFKRLSAKDNSACAKGDCIRPFEIRVGKAVLSFADHQTASSLTNPVNGLPKVYWIDQNQ